MKITMGYIIALIAGLFIGWLAQQFWLAKTTVSASQSSIHAIARQQQRLLNLQQQVLTESSVSSEEVTSPLSSSFRLAIEQENLELAVDLFSRLDHRLLENAFLLSDLAFKHADYPLLFSTLYELRHALDFAAEARLLSEISKRVDKVDQLLAETSDYDQLVDIYRLLTSLEAENTLYYLRLSYWQLQAGKPIAAAQSLAGAKNDIQLESEVKKLQAAIDQFEQFGAHIRIPLRVVGEHYLVPVNLAWGRTLELMLDTGASKTVIKRSIFDESFALASQNLAQAVMNTANGQAVGYITDVENVGIGDLNLKSLSVVLMDLPSFEYDGLLGMNVLKQFDFNIDQENAVLKLLPKKPSLNIQP